MRTGVRLNVELDEAQPGDPFGHRRVVADLASRAGQHPHGAGPLADLHATVAAVLEDVVVAEGGQRCQVATNCVVEDLAVEGFVHAPHVGRAYPVADASAADDGY